MNRIYQVIWSSVKDCYVVVSENAGRYGKKKAVHLAPSTTKRTMLAMSLGAAVLFGSAASASAATGNKVIGGSQDAVTDAKGNTDQAVATGDYSTISGGYLNHAEGNYSSVSGGSDNQAFGEDSSVSGGGQNKATGKGASVAGGFQNQAGGEFSTVSGGSGNKAFGWGSIVIGGTGNVAGKVAVDDNGNYLTDANGNQYPANQGLIGQVSVAIGGVSSSVQGNSSVGIAGGSTSAKAASGLAAGKQATVTMANGVAIGYESTASVIDASRTADTEGRIVSFGHQAGDVYYTVDHQNHTVTENNYDSAAYNRLVNVADGIDDHDVVVMEQLKALASQGMNFSASNKVDGAYKTVKKNLGDTVAVRANDAQDGHTYKTDNLTTEIDDNGIITVKMDTKLTADKVTVGTGDN
ncbi:MAG: S-layer protein, partial [Mitsuokella jalaludinii]|nr:S-layer protein [Mitsuokella jalaludinii]